MHVNTFDRYEARHSLIHRLDPRVKVIITVAFIFANVLLPDGAWLAFLASWAMLLLVQRLAQLSWGYAFRRSFVALPFVLAAVTMGSATTGPGLQWRRFFFHCDRVFLVMDDDEAGAIGLAKWQEQLPAARLMPPLPVGGDITDAWAAGVDLAEWVTTAV